MVKIILRAMLKKTSIDLLRHRCDGLALHFRGMFLVPAVLVVRWAAPEVIPGKSIVLDMLMVARFISWAVRGDVPCTDKLNEV